VFSRLNKFLVLRISIGSSNHSAAMKAAIDNLQILDTWEQLNGNVVEYTYVRPGIGARLDRIYVSNLRTNILMMDGLKVGEIKISARGPQIGPNVHHTDEKFERSKRDK
jgi:hypothetical protein